MEDLKLIEILIFSVAIPLFSRFILNPLIKTTKRKNQGVEWFNIGRGIVALLLINNPDWNKDQIVDRALEEILQKIKSIKRETARRIISDAYVTLKSGQVK